jgi:hypothetical protein
MRMAFRGSERRLWVGMNSWSFIARDHDRESRADFDLSATATDGVSFLGFFRRNANKTVS